MAGMQLTVFLLCLMAPCGVITCQLYEYRFIQKEKTWTEAKKYCRETHTELATVTNMTDVKRLCEAADETHINDKEAWIGLHSADIDRTWHWSLPGLEFNYTEVLWGEGEPNDKEDGENCGFIRWNQTTENLVMGDVSCESTDGVFLCYNETTRAVHLIPEHKKWLEAQRYCRRHHTDLASGPNQLIDNNLTHPTHFMLMGLFRDTWLWSDGSSFSFRNWDVDFKGWQEREKRCAVVGEDGTWKNIKCDKEKHFICYDDKVVLVKENKTWEEALEHCREKHHELVSIMDLDEQRWIQDRAKQADTDFVWTGLRYTCTLGFWFWITDEVVSYKNWATNGQIDECDMSGAMETKGQHKWISQPDEERFNFICSKK